MIKSFVLTLLLSVTLSAQDSPEARAILKMVSDASQTVRSYRAEFKYSTETKSPSASTSMKMESKATLAFLPPDKMRIEMNSGVPVQVISDGKAAWTYMPTMKQYSKLPPSTDIKGMAQGISGTMPAPWTLQSARILREEPVVVDSVPISCFVIAAEYQKPESTTAAQTAPSHSETTVWVNKIRYTVLRSRSHNVINSAQFSGPMETTMEMLTTSLKWDVAIAEEEFAFTPPQGATEVQLGISAAAGLAAPASGKEPSGGAYRIGGGVSAPSLLFKVEPKYSDEARKAGKEGTVVLYVVVDEKGMPAKLRVIRPLGLGLDEKALEAVQQWRFKPGIKDGKPVSVQATIEVNFRLPKSTAVPVP